MAGRSEWVRLCRARDMLREVRDTRVLLREVAREAGMSPFHFIRQFEAMFGQTPHQFRMHRRLERAKELLALSDYSVTDVCMEVGFESLGSFSTLFARRVGSAPSAYRRQVRSVIVVPGMLPEKYFPGCLTLMGRAFAILEKQQREGLAD